MSLFGQSVRVSDQGTLPTIRVQAVEDDSTWGYWSGMTAAELAVIATDLYATGTLSSAQYIVALEPLNHDSIVGSLELFEDDMQKKLPFLATSTTMSVLDAQTDSVQAGHYQLNHITSNSTGDVTINFMETKGGHVLKFAKDLKEIMFNNNGTQELPYEYLMRLTIGLFPRHNRDSTAVAINTSQTYCVALQAASVELAAQNKDPLEVPLTFIKMFPMLAK